MEALAKAYREGGFGIAPDAAKAADWTAKLAAIRGQNSRSGGRR
jgi:hypothetical protein